MRTKLLPILILSLAYGVEGCGSNNDSGATGGSSGGTSSTQEIGSGTAGSGGSSSVAPSSSSTPTGGNPEGGSSSAVTSSVVTGGSPVGGTSAKGGASGTTTIPTGGSSAVGGTTTVLSSAGGSARGGTAATGGKTATGGAGGTATGGTPTGGTPVGGSMAIDCLAAMPTSAGTTHCGSYKTGKAGNLSFELWSNSYSSNACITYYSVPAFSAKWNNNSDFLARVGVEWGGKSIATLGEITAEFTYKKSGTSGGYSYIGIYGWATSPCVEYYIIDDSFNGMPFKPWNMTEKGSATIDGEVYKFFSGPSNGTGGSRCNGGGSFTQYWSVRQKGRSCGVMTITKHFEEWKKAGMAMDNILEAKVLVESGGGQGSIEFPIANVKAVK